ncbi:DUF2935 domain-containing protein [Paenibacillus sp. MBLB4367]|uniref:DUF2935 domain-containing protein n=1 Tax=Paenibacillus sp. MBLB4367 TaxID=3384767 RepID=UPI003907F498
MMATAKTTQAALFEHRFWLQLMGDHARIIADKLSPKEEESFHAAQLYVQAFDELLDSSRGPDAESNVDELNQQAYTMTIQLRAFKLDLLAKRLLGKVEAGLPPTMLSHMVNELEEYVRILQALSAGKSVPVFDALHHDMLWLSSASGHASFLAGEMDPVEKRLIKQCRQFESQFQEHYVKGVELAGYTRTQLRDYPAMRRFHQEINKEMKRFIGLLKELEELEHSSEAIGRLSPLMPDHVLREAYYYLHKLAMFEAVPKPDGDPTKPRTAT